MCHPAILTLDTVGGDRHVAEVKKTQTAEQFIDEALSNWQDTRWRAIDATLVQATLVGPGDARHLSGRNAWSDIVDVLPHQAGDVISSEVPQVSRYPLLVSKSSEAALLAAGDV